MSNRAVSMEGFDATDVFAVLRRWYHVPLVAAFMVFILYVRLRPMDDVAMREGAPTLSAVDSWYHWRTVSWTVENYPWTMPFEVYTTFPTGTYVGAFGTLFDQLIATAALIVGLGDPSIQTVYTVALVAVPVLAALVAIPVFFLGNHFGGRLGGVVAVAYLALSPGTFLQRTTAGQLQHHVAEVLFMAIAVFTLVVALRVAEEEMPIYELVAERDWETIKRPAIYSALAGVALFLYLWSWPPGVVLIGILGVFFTVHLCLEFVRGRVLDPVAFVGAVSLTVAGVLFLLKNEVWSFHITHFGLLQPLLAFMVAAGCVFLVWFGRVWEERSLEPQYFPLAVLGLIVVALGAMSLVVPDIFNTLVNNFFRRLTPIDPAVSTLTIAEAQPPRDFTGQAFRQFGMGFYVMLLGLAIIVAGPFLGREYRADHSLLLVWAVFLTSMAMTQQRFWYYFILPVAIGNAVFIREVVDRLDLGARNAAKTLGEIETYQVIVLATVILVLFVPFMPPFAGATAMDVADSAGPSQDAMIWEESNQWLAENTPEPGNYGGADNASELDFLGTYEVPEDENFEYPEGAYGVLAWWDYGHLITVQAERIPLANPFQHNARPASAFFTADSEERAELILDAVAEGAEVHEQSDDELEALIGDGDSHEDIRYVMIDYGAASGKFPAITQWQGPDYDYFTTPEDWQSGEFVNTEEATERFSDLPVENTMLSRLYFDNADGLEHYRLVHENSQRAQIVSYAVAEGGQVITLDDGSPYIRVNQNRHSPGIDREIQAVLAQDNYDLIELSNHVVPAVKTFERVEGATLTGSVDPDDVDEDASVLVYAHVESNLGEGFSYFQEAPVEADGSFEVTMPYATDNELTVEDGYTNTSVVANDVIVGVGAAVDDPVLADGMTFDQLFEDTPLYGETEVPESAVVFGEEVEVELEEIGS